MRPLGPKTEKLYASSLRRAFGAAAPSSAVPAHVRAWGESSLALLRAALKRHCQEAGLDAEWIKKALPRKYAVRKVLRVPGEAEAAAYEKAAARCLPGVRVLALLPIALGLRAAEVVTLQRQAVQEALKTGDLIVLRKGGKEQVVPAGHLHDMLKELLDTRPAKPQPKLRGPAPLAPRRIVWTQAGEVLSAGDFQAQYQKLRALVAHVGKEAGLEHVHPHLLRHAYATRLNRDGAPLFTVQAALGHASITTTQRYVHASAQDVAKFQRPAPRLDG